MSDQENLPISRLYIVKKFFWRLLIVIIPVLITTPFFFILPRLNNPEFISYPWSIFFYYLAPFVLIFSYGFILDFLNILSIKYSLTANSIETKKGFFSVKRKIVLFEKIQNINLKQDFLDQIFGLRTIYLQTAGGQFGPSIKLEGLNKNTAQKLLEFLQEKIKL